MVRSAAEAQAAVDFAEERAAEATARWVRAKKATQIVSREGGAAALYSLRYMMHH